MTEATSATDLVMDEAVEDRRWRSRRHAASERAPAPPTGRLPARKHALTEIIVVTSGKGGVGKTTTSASLACGLARRGKRVAVIDFDVGLRNLDLIMGCERRVVYDFVNVIQGDCTLKQALIKDKRFETCSCWPPRRRATRTRCPPEGVRRCWTS